MRIAILKETALCVAEARRSKLVEMHPQRSCPDKEICCMLVLISERYGNKGSNTANNKLTVLRAIKASRPATRSQSTGEKLPFGSLADRVVG